MPGTIGPSSFVHSGNFKANKPQPIVSNKHNFAVLKANSLFIL